jgi:hypothetical protein
MVGTSKDNNKNVRLSMKEAFERIKPSRGIIKVGVDKDRKFSIRDWLWDYPTTIYNLFRRSSPLSFILVFIIFGFGIFNFLSSETLAGVFNNKRTQVFVEGNVGAISSFNPIFTTQNVIDKDIHALVFEKFIDITPEGEPKPNIADSWVKSDDGKTYDFTNSLDHIIGKMVLLYNGRCTIYF